MQNVSQESSTDNPKIDKVTAQHDIGNSSSTPQSTSNSSPAKSETETYSEHRRYMSETSESEEDSVSEEDTIAGQSEESFLLSPSTESTDDSERPTSSNSTSTTTNNEQSCSSRRTKMSNAEYETPKCKKAKSKADMVLDKVAMALDSSSEDKFDIIGKNFAHKLRDSPREINGSFGSKCMNDILFEAEIRNLNRSSRLSIYNSVSVAPTQTAYLPQPQIPAAEATHSQQNTGGFAVSQCLTEFSDL